MPHAGMRALLVTLDPWLATTFADVSREVGIESQKSADTRSFPEELRRTKYEALLMDFDTVSETVPIIAGVRESPSKKNAVVFAVATTAAHKQQALEQGANFVLERPFASTEIRRALYAAYDLILVERRRYFRCAAELAVRLIQKSSGASLECTTMNVSSNGMAIKTHTALTAGEELSLDLLLPDTELPVRAAGVVIWDDKHGKSGLHFQCVGPEMQKKLDSWLNTRFSSLITWRFPFPGAK